MREITRKSFRQECKICHKKKYKISQNGLCVKCAAEKVLAARCQMKTKEGPVYEKWKRKIIKSLEVL